MKTWHLAILVVIAFALGSLYPGPVAAIRAKIGM